MAANVDFTSFRAEDGSNTKRRIQGIYNGPSSYVAGGDPFLPGDIKLGQIDVLLFEPGRNTAHTVFYFLVYNKGSNLVLWIAATTGLEPAGATDLSGYSARFEAIGR